MEGNAKTALEAPGVELSHTWRLFVSSMRYSRLVLLAYCLAWAHGQQPPPSSASSNVSGAVVTHFVDAVDAVRPGWFWTVLFGFVTVYCHVAGSR